MTKGTVINELYYTEEKFLNELKNDYEGKNFEGFVRNILLNLKLKLSDKEQKLTNKALGTKDAVPTQQEPKPKAKAQPKAKTKVIKKNSIAPADDPDPQEPPVEPQSQEPPAEPQPPTKAKAKPKVKAKAKPKVKAKPKPKKKGTEEIKIEVAVEDVDVDVQPKSPRSPQKVGQQPQQ